MGRKGMLIWTGQAATGDVLTITGTHASKGIVSGTLPRRPATMNVYPAAFTTTGLTVFTANPRHLTSPAAATRPGAPVFIYDPRRATDMTVFEAPSAHNDWQRLVLRVNTPVTACVVEWQH